MPLCPNHHKLYDNHLLNMKEIERLPPEAYKYYMEEKKPIKSALTNSIMVIKQRRERDELKRKIFG